MVARKLGAALRAPAPLVLAAIVAAGLLVRLPLFDDSLYGDELSTYYTVVGHGIGTTLDFVRSDQELTPPLYYLLSWVPEQLGDPAQTLKLVSLLAGVAAIPLTYLLGAWTLGRRTGLLAAALMALNPFLIFYSTEARAYALVTLLGLLAAISLLAAIRTRRARWWVAYAAFSCAAIYTHYTAAFLLAGMFAWALYTSPQTRRALLLANLAAAVAFAPWFGEFVNDNNSGCAKLIAQIAEFSLSSARVDFGKWSIGHPLVPLDSLPGAAALVLAGAGIGLGLVGLAAAARRRTDRPRSLPPEVALIVVMALAAPAGTVIFSLLGSGIFLPRNLISSSPGLALAIAALALSAPARARLVAVVLVLAGFGIGSVKMLSTRYQRPDYQRAADLIARVGSPGDPVVVIPDISPGPLNSIDVTLGRFARSDGGTRPPILRAGKAPLRAVLELSPGNCSPFPLPAPAPAILARRAARLAAQGGRLFVVVPFEVSLATLRKAGVGEPVAGGAPVQSILIPFLAALPPTLRPSEAKTFPGIADVSVVVLG